jgi:hypothetical protein
MAQTEHLRQLARKLTDVAGDNLLSVVLHGSAVAGDFHPQFSDLNVLCVMSELSPAAMRSLVPVLRWWTDIKYPAPLFFTRAELPAAADVFPIEMLDIKERHTVLHGEDPFQQLEISMALHRIQLEHELRTKILLLRQHYMSVATNAGRVRHLLLDSVSHFLALFRHALIAMGATPPDSKAEVAYQLAGRAEFDPAPFEQLLKVRERRIKADELDLDRLFSAYLVGIERVIQVVDGLKL